MFIKRLYKQFLSLIKAIPGEIYIFLISFLYRLPTLGYDFINNDSYHWKERGYAFGSALTSLNFAGTAVTYHPGVPLLWTQFIAIKIYSALLKLGVLQYTDSKDEFLINNFIQTAVVVFLTSVLLALAYQQLKRIAGFKVAVLTVIFILVEPFYLALSRTIHTDAMISLFMFISVLYFYSYIISNNKKLVTSDSVFAGMFAGLAFLTKSSALFLIPFFILIAGIFFLNSRNIKLVYKTLLIIAFSVVAFFVFWPAMWVTPVESVNLYLFKGVQGIAIEDGHEHLWFGEVTADPGPLFYPIVFVGRYSLVLVALFIFSIYLLIRKRGQLRGNERLKFMGLLMLFVIFYLLMISLVSKKLDRYSLPIVFPVAVLATWALSEVSGRKLLMLFISILTLFRVLLLWGLHPNYLAYYSPLIGGVEEGRYVIEPKWLVGYNEVADFFNEKQRGEEEPIKVAIADFDYLRPFADFEVLNIKHGVERDSADYFVLPVYQEERNQFYIDAYVLKEPDEIIKIAGVEYYEVYKIKRDTN